MTNENLESLVAKKTKLFNQAEKYRAKMEKCQDGVRVIQKEIHDTCDRQCGNVKRQESYYPGGYLDTAYTDRWLSCDVCRYYQKLKTENHGWYG